MEKKVLKIQEYLRKNGLAKAIQEFKLKTRIYEHKVLLKYDQLESPMSFDEVKECRGLILSKDNWDILCYSFFKFFNHGESQAAKIDWNTAVVLEKLDGTMIQVYWDWHKKEWFAATTGMAEGEGQVNNKMGTTFNELFWNTLDKVSPIARNSFNFFKGFTFVFELTTPYNIVVKPHGESSITLLAARDNRTLEEIPYDKLARAAESFQVPLVKAFDLNAKDFGALIKTFEGMPWSEEGYVVVDANFNRVKIKNPAYVAVHHLKSKTAEHNILTVVKSNEIEEFAATFPERREEIFKLKANYDALIAKLNEAWVELEPRKPKNITPAERKNYATAVFEVTKKYGLDSFTGLYFALQTGKIDTIKEYMMEYDDKKLYKML
jgi:T4 RnlA family RNA ligase